MVSSSFLAYRQRNTYLKPPLNPHTLSSVLHRHNIVVSGVRSKPLREGNGGSSIWGGGGVSVEQVSVGWVCTILNGAGVPWLKNCALHIQITWICGVNTDSKDVNV